MTIASQPSSFLLMYVVCGQSIRISTLDKYVHSFSEAVNANKSDYRSDCAACKYVCHLSSSFFRVYIGLDAGTHFDRALELIALCTFCALCFLCATRLLPAGILPCCLNF